MEPVAIWELVLRGFAVGSLAAVTAGLWRSGIASIRIAGLALTPRRCRASLPDKFLHAPWTADASTLANAGVTLGATYPHPIVDHDVARRRALDAFATLPR